MRDPQGHAIEPASRRWRGGHDLCADRRFSSLAFFFAAFSASSRAPCTEALRARRSRSLASVAMTSSVDSSWSSAASGVSAGGGASFGARLDLDLAPQSVLLRSETTYVGAGTTQVSPVLLACSRGPAA